MAKNGASGRGRNASVKGRSQVRSSWTKRDSSTGRFTQVKKTGGSFKRIRREK